ncbi:MAG TPA: 1,4-dihydroxy-2-naphthoate octaprenyltransferase [Ktedonobacteraceae bacterium]|nr:1,4-dihydroxy-2-naphthoate octaprenyltransferase [Ktedonobacteraceae bacterium]
MESEDFKNNNRVVDKPKPTNSTHIVTADSVQAEEVPTIPLSSLKTISEMQPAIAVRPVNSTVEVSLPAPLVTQPTEYRRSTSEWLQIWRDGMRLAFLPLAVLPVLVGSIVAWTQTISSKAPLGKFHLTHFLLSLVTVALLQLGANLVNDYYDYLRGIDTSNALGPGGLIQQGLIKPSRVLAAGLALLGVGIFLGLFVAAAGGPIVYLLGFIGVLCAYFYSASQRALSSKALGEVVAFCVFGPFITLGAYTIQTGQPSLLAVFYGIPLGLLAAAVVHINDMRDTEGDTHAGKRTFASILGFRWSRVWFLVLLLGAYAVVAALGIPHGSPHPILLALWTLPTLVVIITGILRTDTPAGLHAVMRQVILLEIYFALLLVAGLLIAAFLAIVPHIPAILPI